MICMATTFYVVYFGTSGPIYIDCTDTSGTVTNARMSHVLEIPEREELKPEELKPLPFILKIPPLIISRAGAINWAYKTIFTPYPIPDT